MTRLFSEKSLDAGLPCSLRMSRYWGYDITERMQVERENRRGTSTEPCGSPIWRLMWPSKAPPCCDTQSCEDELDSVVFDRVQVSWEMLTWDKYKRCKVLFLGQKQAHVSSPAGFKWCVKGSFAEVSYWLIYGDIEYVLLDLNGWRSACFHCCVCYSVRNVNQNSYC